ncbi:MAG TPA: hypothetical protein VI072_31575 [Polyangiaceae bacterium]
MTYSAGIQTAPTTEQDIDEEVRISLASIQRQRSLKRVVALSTLFLILVLAAGFVYLTYSSAPGTMRPIPASQR